MMVYLRGGERIHVEEFIGFERLMARLDAIAAEQDDAPAEVPC
jgi:hypothetical protein